ncbi:MAG: hypothetical protein HY819_02880 [Acidobacteria bacterium]|nr:hypothetical protein [Acidobacteriota bacterium]
MPFNDKNKKVTRNTNDTGLLQPSTPEDIEHELEQKLASLGINLSGGMKGLASRNTQALPTVLDDKKTSILDINELRNALKQQISIAEIKSEIEKTIRQIMGIGPIAQGETQELELRAAILMLPYCKEYIPDFPQEVRPAEFAVDLNLQDIIDFHSDMTGANQEELDEMIEQYAVQIIQVLLSHPLIPQKDAKKIGVDLKTTALKDERGTALYSNNDAQFLEILFGEQKLLERGGEIGLLAILISAKKWNKIDSDSLFNNAVLYTLEAMAKKRGIPGIVLRGQGEDHPVAYILGEYIVHSIDQSLEILIKFMEDFLTITREAVNAPPEVFISSVYHNYLPKLKTIFRNSIHESFDRFIETFKREYQNSQQSVRSKIFFLKRIGDICELSFYTYEALRVLESASGEVYAKENLDEGTAHYASRNSIPLDETSDILSQKNTLSELLMFVLKQRCNTRDRGTPRVHFVSKLMNDTLFFLDSLRRVFDHGYARGRAVSSNDYSSWEEIVADCSRGYARLFFSHNLNDLERYHFENIYKRLVERHLSFFDLQSPTLFQPDIKLDKIAKSKTPEDTLKEKFLQFLIALHQALLNFHAEKLSDATKIKEDLDVLTRLPGHKTNTPVVRQNNTAAFTQDALQTRVFLSQSELPLSDYTLEVLLSVVSPDAKDKTILIQALRMAVEVTGKARTSEEIATSMNFLQNLRQRMSLLIVLAEQEKEQWVNSILASLKELEQSDPISISSYGIVLNEIEDWDPSEERILNEWKNPETTILRTQQILFILLLKYNNQQIQSLIDQYQRWLSLNTLPSDSVRRKVFERRQQTLSNFSRKSGFKLKFLRFLLSTLRYIQLSYQITSWEQPEAYLLEDLLAVETPVKRVQEISIVLSTKEPLKVNNLVQQFTKVLRERFQQSASGYSYYTDEEKLLMENRLSNFEAICKRSSWQASQERILFSIAQLLVKPMKRLSNQDS